MNCHNLETLIRFAVREPNAADAELAAHVYACQRCREVFRDVCEVVRCDSVKEPTVLEKMRYGKMLAKGVKPQDKMAEIISWFARKLEERSSLCLSSEQPPYINAYAVCATYDNSTPMKKAPCAPQIVFESKRQYSMSPLYWKAVMHLPLVMTVNSEWEIFVYDAAGDLIPEAVLLFRGIPLEVKAGKAKISFHNFRNKSIQTPGIGLCFPRQSEPVPGDILFL